MTTAIKTTLKFFYNGLKDSSGKLQKCFYCNGKLLHHPEGTVTIYARDYSRFSQEVREYFTVQNNTDSMTDYFDTDRIRVTPNHPLYTDVLEAFFKQDAKREEIRAKRNLKK